MRVAVTLRKMARTVFEAEGSQVFRRGVMRREAQSESRFVDSQAALGDVRAIEFSGFRDFLAPKPLADTFFILGSGSSIEDLSEENFAEIRRHRSVGINNWGVHPFVPDIYSFESVPTVGDGQDLPRALNFLNRDDILYARPPLLLLRPRCARELVHLAKIPSALQDNVFFYGRISPATRLEKNLVSDIDFFFKAVTQRYPGVVLDSGASVVRMAFLGLLLGYRNLVFAGVDLTNTQYFWERNPLRLERLQSPPPVNNQQSDRHETMSHAGRAFTVAQMISAISEYVTNVLGGSATVTSPNSALASFLPLTQWGRR